ncbi:MAG TPA: hypothetical protein VLK82_17470 [Candidatus Tectomicrobia bacterium]|nr:hypothetical protein [Candidatus Tectomicrobia bacterium]
MDKHWPFIRVLAIVALGMLASLPLGVHAMTDRERAGLVGPVRQVVIEQTAPSSGWPFSTEEELRSRQQAAFGARVPVDAWFATPERLAVFLATPMAWHGQVVGSFQAWIAEGTGLFEVGPAQWVVLRQVPAGRFTHPGEKALVAGRVRGLSVVLLPPSTTAAVPELQVVALEATPLESRKTVEYDPRGHKTAETSVDFGWELLERKTCQSTDGARGQGRACLTEQYGATGALNWRHRATYDAHGNRLELIDYGHTLLPRLVWKTRNTYDAQGQLMEQVHFRDDGALVQTGTMPTTVEKRWMYDEHGRLLAETGESDGLHGRVWNTHYTYTPHGYRLEEATPGEGRFESRTVTMADPHGNTLEKICYSRLLCDQEAPDAAGPLAEFERHSLGYLGPHVEDECLVSRDHYTYEMAETTGNWRKQIISRWKRGHVGEESLTVIYRTITYEGTP